NGFGRIAPELVLFDMDGTLFDSMPNHAVAWTRAFESVGVRFTPEDAYITEGARGIDTIRKYVYNQKGKNLTEAQAQEIYDEKARIFASLPVPEIMAGAIELMEKITAGGMTIGIVTGSAQRPLISRILSDFGKYVSEERIITAFDVEKGKPDPEPYIQGMRKCGGAKPYETIVVENAPLGIRSGHLSGAFTIAVNTGPLDDELLKAEQPDLLLKSINELAACWDFLRNDCVRMRRS
ncbi:MAG: HAD hydrolase-like protein, partial [Prevotella sp.]|nr:HAD hydrolase-like protein [Prevotella sp.]